MVSAVCGVRLSSLLCASCLGHSTMSAPAAKKQKTMAAALTKSWVEYSPECNFPIQNLPFGVFSDAECKEQPRCASAIGDFVIDLAALAAAGLFTDAALQGGKVFSEPALNGFMAMGRPAWTATRATLTDLLKEGGNPALKDNAELRAKVLVPMNKTKMHLPARIGDYTDFYSSRYHATNVGIMFRGKDNALQPNWTWLPVGYHGRASSVVVSGTDLHRPRGQLRPDPKLPPKHDVCKLMDFELEMAFFVGPGNELGHPISMKEAGDNIFGLCVMNDWSARDIQKWEYVPLGPFGGKNLGTTITPWVVTMDALEPFRIPNQVQDPECLPYLKEEGLSCFDIKLQVTIQGENMDKPHVVSDSNAKYLYWNFKQQLVHHSVTGCNMRPGDLLGSGTISGPEPHEYGSMLEISWKGSKPVDMPDGTQRKFLANGDEVNMIGFCQGDGFRVGFGDCKGKVLPPVELKN